jgi:hypothetical protein
MHRLAQLNITHLEFLAMHRAFMAGIRRSNSELINEWSN